jgi:hypothetical protein
MRSKTGASPRILFPGSRIENSEARVRTNSDPLTVHEVKQFLDAVTFLPKSFVREGVAAS